MLVLNVAMLEMACYYENYFSTHGQGLGQPVQTIY